ncbi:uncharacterized protein [Acropora muricata]|uniref:uncharacterized protein isoform X4 n=1 Tax=Acropora muricata TaxID=159855 RepID=UPI0034E3D3EA
MSMLRKDGNFPSTSCATSQEAQENRFTGQSPTSALKVTLLSSEWRSTKGGLSTINRELAIQLAKHSNVEVSMYLPQCSEKDKRAAAVHNVCIIEAKEKPGYDPIDWLATIPRDHQMDFVIGHGIHLGKQVPLIKEVHRECKWIQVVHTDPGELGMLKNDADSIAKGQEKHQAEVKLCELADQVVAIGPKLAEAFSRYLQSCGKDQEVLNLTPGIFSEFAVTQTAKERGRFHVLVFGRGDMKDFNLKGYDIAARAVAELCRHEPYLFKLVFVGAPKGEEEKVKEKLLKEGIAASELIVCSYMERGELAAQFFAADLSVMPSRTEGFGLAGLEALSAGLPVLVSGNSGLGDALKALPFGWSCVVNSEDASEWAKAIRTIYDRKRKLRLREAVKIRESYAEEYHWEGECGRLVERMLNIIQGTSTAPDQPVAAVNLGEQGPSSVSESVSYPDATTIQHIVGDAVSSGGENGEVIKLVIEIKTGGKENKGGINVMLTQIVQAHDEGSDHTRGWRSYVKSFTSLLTKIYKVIVLHVCTGSIVVSLRCPTLESLEHLRSDYRSGDLDKLAKRYLVTDEIKKKLNLETIYLETTIDEENYFNCKRALMELPSTCSENPGKDLLHPSETTTTEEKRQNTDVPEKNPGKDLLHPSETTTTEKKRQNTDVPENSSEGQSAEKQGRRPLHLHPSATPPVMEQRRDTDTRRVFTHNSVAVKLLKAEYNRRAQLRPLLWDSTIQLPPGKVYTRLKILSRRRGGNQGKTKCWGDAIWIEDFWRDEILTEARANEANPCDVFAVLKENKDVMTIVEGSPGIGKTTFCLKLAYDWANQSSSAVSFPEFELVLLLKCRDIDGDLTEAITEQLFPENMSKDAREELLRFLEDIENQERVLIILDGLDELAEKSKHYVDDLLHRKRWASCYVLTTTRQEKGIESRKQPEFVFNLFLQIEGFTEEDSFEYIRRHFKIAGPEHSSKGASLIKEIKKNALLQDLQKNPLSLLLLCVVYEDHEGELPSFLTDLYHVIVLCLLRRYCAKHDVKASKEDMDLEKQFERDVRCLGELAWNCILNDRHSFFEEELQELEKRNEKLVARELGFVYKEESLKRLKPQHAYSFLHQSFQEYLAASYVAHKLRRNKLNVFEKLDFDAVVKKFPQVFVFVCGILREEASILFAQIGEKLKSDWDWLKCSEAAEKFFIDSWSESGNAEGMANTLCSLMPFPRVTLLSCQDEFYGEDWNLFRVLLFCRRFSKVEAPDEIRFKASLCTPLYTRPSAIVKDLESLPNLKALDFLDSYMHVEFVHELFQSLPNFASLTVLALPDVPEKTDWGLLANALTRSETLETVGCFLMGERGESWAKALDAGLCADTPLSSVDLRICGPMSETALQALGNLLLSKSLSFVSVIVMGDMSHSLAVTLSRALAGETAVKSLDLSIFGKLNFCCANLIERGIVNNNSLSNLVVLLCGELPDNWPAIVSNLNVRLVEKSTVTFAIYPNTFIQVTATQLTDFCPCVINYGFFEQERVTLNVWGELTVDGAEALYNPFPCTWSCPLTLNIHGKLREDFLHCTARHVDKQKPFCPLTINTWEQLTNEGKALFKGLELDKNPAVTLNVCEVHVPSDELGDNKVESIDDPESLVALLKGEGSTEKETINVQRRDPSCVDSEDSTCDHSDGSTGRSWYDSQRLPRNCTRKSLTLTINNCTEESTELSYTLIRLLEGFISLKSLTLTLNEYKNCKDTCAFLLREGLRRNTSLISLTLTVNIYTRSTYLRYIDPDDISVDGFFPNISMDSFTLTVNDFSSSMDSDWERVDIIKLNSVCGVKSGDLWPNDMSLNTFNLTINNRNEVSVSSLLEFLDEVMKVNSLRTLRLKFNHWPGTEYDFSKLEVKNPSLELIELTICRYGFAAWTWDRRVGWLETLNWEKQ